MIAWYLKMICLGLLLVRFVAAQFGFLWWPAWWWAAEGFGLGLVVLGAGCAAWHGFLLRGAEGLETRRGLFRCLRHPMYAGDLLTLTGLALLPLGPDSLALWLLGVVAVYRSALFEDRLMSQAWPSAHERWRERSGLILPRIRRGSSHP
ncbi:MAG: hypothetical protein EA370_16205 [Wenzhouxiangella sp.]|nr:MAG: hypothetical protein EA370_16205 [Wenzhouxiangella sp.]